ncbi:MAG: metal-dependent hydrolase [Alphaproteobacteria bacterium]|nr:metal-dependent hydrolase [Alphaproteobacteria bacterium]
MDPFTQGMLAAALPQATARKGAVALAGIFGFVAGLSPDLDVLIRSTEDPLLFLEYHRQFTHALVFIPIGGLLSAVLLHFLIGRRWRLPFLRSLIFCTLGYGTHGLLDFATSYGTMLFWPFSDERYAASIISVIDPAFTLPVALLAVAAGVRRSPIFARMALGWVAFYLTLGFVQHEAARGMAEELARARGHQVVRLTAKPSFGNILIWKTLYETEDRYYVDAVRPGPAPAIFPGTSVARLDTARDFPWLDPASQQFRDIERFRWFSQGYVARNPSAPDQIIDVRYSFLPNDIKPLWSIELAPKAEPDAHVRFRTDRGDARAGIAALWAMVTAERK